jgi:ABC-type hemin transport system substrate-binding protein
MAALGAAASAPPPLRVVSLLSSATDVVVALGLAHLLVGRSHEARSAASLVRRVRLLAPLR